MNKDEPLVDAPLDAWAIRTRDAQAKAAQAYARLLALAEERDSGQIRRIAQFIASTYNGGAFPFDLFDLRASMPCVGARPTSTSSCPMVSAACRPVITAWGLKWPEAD